MENCLPTVLWPKWSQMSAVLFLWLESCGCHHSHFFSRLVPFICLPKVGGWHCRAFAPTAVGWWQLQTLPLLDTCSSGQISHYKTQKCSKLRLNERLIRETLSRSIFDLSVSWMNSFWRLEFSTWFRQEILHLTVGYDFFEKGIILSNFPWKSRTDVKPLLFQLITQNERPNLGRLFLLVQVFFEDDS